MILVDFDPEFVKYHWERSLSGDSILFPQIGQRVTISIEIFKSIGLETWDGVVFHVPD
jgi:hypothetical protein